MRPHRRAVLALGGGITLAGALAAPVLSSALAAPVLAEPYVQVAPSPTASVACVDRAAAATAVVDGGLGITSVAALPAPADQPVPPPPPPPPVNPAIAVVTVDNPGDELFAALVSRDDDVPVPVIVDPRATVTAAFEVADGAISTFKVTDVTGGELAFVVSTSDCTAPLGWCDDVRDPGAPVAADNADICDVDGDGVFTVPGDPTEPAPTGQIADDAEVLTAAQTTPAPPESGAQLPHSAIAVPSTEPAAPPPPAPEVAAPPALAAPPQPELALSGSRNGALASLAALLLGTGVAVLGAGQRRIDAELDVRMCAAMSRIASAASPHTK